MSINSYTLSDNKEEKSFFEKIFEYKAGLLIFIGIAARVIMLFYYYYTHMIDPNRSWGDVGLNFKKPVFYPPLTTFLLYLFIFLSFNFIEIFAFYAFLWDLLSCLMFYFVLKSFNIKNRNYVFGLFLINPFWFLNNSFSLANCGYHITDAFFFFFFFIALIYYPKEHIHARYMFYIFLGLSMCTKYYTLLTVPLFFLKYLIEKDWKELKALIICIFPLIILLIIVPFFCLSWYSNESYTYVQLGYNIPIYVRIIPMILIMIIFTIFRLKNSDQLEISIISIIAVGSLIYFSYPYLRWFQCIVLFGILKEKEFFTFNLNLGFKNKQLSVNNHNITLFLSTFGVFLSYLYIIYIFNNSIL